jgi:hypothetical protein
VLRKSSAVSLSKGPLPHVPTLTSIGKFLS